MVMFLESIGEELYPLVMRYGTNEQGKTICYFLNYSNDEQSFKYYYAKGTDLLS